MGIQEKDKMSLHKSLKPRKNKPKSVLARFERLKRAIEENKWREGNSIFGLPKFNPPSKLKSAKKDETKTATTLGKTDIIQEHLAVKEKAGKDKKKKKIKKETTGIK